MCCLKALLAHRFINENLLSMEMNDDVFIEYVKGLQVRLRALPDVIEMYSREDPLDQDSAAALDEESLSHRYAGLLDWYDAAVQIAGILEFAAQTDGPLRNYLSRDDTTNDLIKCGLGTVVMREFLKKNLMGKSGDAVALINTVSDSIRGR